MNQRAQALISLLQSETDVFVRARYIHKLRNEEQLSIKEIGKSINKDPTYISHIVRLLKLPSIVIDGFYGKQISLTHLLIVSRLKTQKKMQIAYKIILEKNLNVIEAENLVRQENYQIVKVGDRLNKDELSAIVSNIKKANPDLDVKVVQTRIKGKIVLETKGETAKTTKIIQNITSKLISDSNIAMKKKKEYDSLVILD